MTAHTPVHPATRRRFGRFGTAWLSVAIIGQLAFIGFIILQFGVPMVAGQWAAWNDKPLIDGYKAGDLIGNLVFIGHALGAAVMTGAGLLQLFPLVRRRAPTVHRWSGRVFFVLAIALSLSGLWLGWVRGTRLSLVSAGFVSLNACLIMGCCVMAWRRAVARRIAEHRRWALRAFIAASGVWFLRVGIMAWVLINQGPRWMNSTLSGPADLAIQFSSFVLPLLILEIYFRAEDGRLDALTGFAGAMMVAATVLTAIGVFGTVAFMWLPYL